MVLVSVCVCVGVCLREQLLASFCFMFEFPLPVSRACKWVLFTRKGIIKVHPNFPTQTQLLGNSPRKHRHLLLHWEMFIWPEMLNRLTSVCTLTGCSTGCEGWQQFWDSPKRLCHWKTWLPSVWVAALLFTSSVCCLPMSQSKHNVLILSLWQRRQSPELAVNKTIPWTKKLPVIKCIPVQTQSFFPLSLSEINGEAELKHSLCFLGWTNRI